MRHLIYFFSFSLIVFHFTSYHSSRSLDAQQTTGEKNVFQLFTKERKQGFKILFDGNSLDQWIDSTNQYFVKNESIVMNPKTRYGGNLYSKGEYDNFIFRFEFMLSPGANSGLGVRH